MWKWESCGFIHKFTDLSSIIKCFVLVLRKVVRNYKKSIFLDYHSSSLSLHSVHPQARPTEAGIRYSRARHCSVPLNPASAAPDPGAHTKNSLKGQKSEGRQFLRRRTMVVLLHLAHPFILGRPQGTQLFGHCDMGQSFRGCIAFN